MIINLLAFSIAKWKKASRSILISFSNSKFKYLPESKTWDGNPKEPMVNFDEKVQGLPGCREADHGLKYTTYEHKFITRIYLYGLPIRNRTLTTKRFFKPKDFSVMTY
jgi:hypothetical protein